MKQPTRSRPTRHTGPAGPTVPPSVRRGAPVGAAARGEETRSALLAAGRSAFARRGFDGASIRDITREAGANLGAVTYHFGSKRGLYVAVLVEGIGPMVDRVGRTAASPGAPLERLEAVVDVFFDYVAANPDIPRLMMQEMTAGKTPPPELVALIRRNAGYVSMIISEGVGGGTLREVHPLLGAVSIVSQAVFINIMAPLLREVGGVDLGDPGVRASVARHVKTFVREGLSSAREASA